jgi:hypothetical protein
MLSGCCSRLVQLPEELSQLIYHEKIDTPYNAIHCVLGRGPIYCARCNHNTRFINIHDISMPYHTTPIPQFIACCVGVRFVMPVLLALHDISMTHHITPIPPCIARTIGAQLVRDGEICKMRVLVDNGRINWAPTHGDKSRYHLQYMHNIRRGDA